MGRILLVEDDQDIREALLELLTDEGYEVDCAVNGQDGLDALKKANKPGLILLDLMMPVKDGAQFRAEQKADPALSSIPVVVMSADNRAASRLEGLEASAYLRKPVEIDELLRVVKSFCTG